MSAVAIPLQQRDRLMVVCDPGGMSNLLRERYPQYEIATSSSYLSGIAALAQQPARGLLVGVDPTWRKLSEAVAGLRKAAGGESRLVLCCNPSGEPAARTALAAGADDYLILPASGAELDRSLALTMPQVEIAPDAHVPTPSWEELNQLAELLAGIDQGRRPMLERLCRIIADSLRTAHVQLVVDNDVVRVGDHRIEPALAEEIVSGGQILGRILVGPRQRSPFMPAEVERLRHYSRLIAHLLGAVERQTRWQSMALIDEGSQLPNRRCLMESLDTLLQRAAHERFRVTVLIFDLDGFKHFNDTYGHAAGDQIIRETGQLFRMCCRHHDIVARYAGDEFVVVFWDAEEPRVAGSRHPTDVFVLLRRFKKALKHHRFNRLGSESVGCITISGGLATFPWDGRTASELIERADQALLQAKRDGKNRIYLVGEEGRSVDQPAAGDDAD